MKYNFDLHMDNDNSLSIILRNIKSDSTVLEFGPANGRMTKYMKEQLNCRIYLSELDEEAGKQALKFAEQLVVGDIENYQWLDTYKDIEFDHIIFADVLEHLRNPQKVLIKAKALLKQSGTILVSVPNLAHNSVLIDLLNNQFKYNSIGLLDDTHIHFFTKNSLDSMIAEAGLYATKQMATYAEVGTIEIKNTVYDVEGINPGYWNKREYGEIYQFVYELSMKKVESKNLIRPVIPHYYFQVYFDENEHWNEENSECYEIDSNVNEKIFSIKLPSELGSIRIDPVNANCTIKVTEVYGLCGKESERKMVTMKATNAESWYKKFYCFKNNDPQIIYKLPEQCHTVIIKIEYDRMEANIEELECFINVINALKLQNAQISVQNTEISTLNNELVAQINAVKNAYEYEKNRADLLQQQRQNLENRKLYKLYKFFKRK